MAANAWAFYDSYSEAQGDGTIDLDTNVLKVALFLAASNAQTVTQATFASLTSELSASGYTAGGESAAGLTWGQVSGVATLQINDVVWTFSAGATFRAAVIYSSDGGTNNLIAFSLLDNTPGDIIIGSGNSFTLQINASGVLTLS